MDLYLKVNQIGTGLSNSQNFKYALTRQANDCTSNIVSQGTFNGVTDNGKVYLFRGSEYPTSNSDTYYLYVWLDAAETDSVTQNQTFNISLGGDCSDNSPYVYTVNIETDVTIGQAIPSTITKYKTPAAAMAAYSNSSFYLKHLMSNDKVSESYVEFVITPQMAQANSGVIAGTYTIRGGDGGASYNANKVILQNAFGSGNCTAASSYFRCDLSGLGVYASSSGHVNAGNGDIDNILLCSVYDDGTSFCD